MTKMYELYYCIYKGEVVYIGQGAKGRHKHCNSGCSHVYELNQIHFQEGTDVLETKVLLIGPSKEKMIELEREHIEAMRPRFNFRYLKGDKHNSKQMYDNKLIKKAILNYPKDSGRKGLTNQFLENYRNLCEEFLRFYSIQEIVNDNVKLHSMHTFINYELVYLSRLMRNIKYKRVENSYCTVFCEALKVLHGVDLTLEKNHVPKETSSMLSRLAPSKLRKNNENTK